MDKTAWQRTFGVSEPPVVDFGLADIPYQAREMTGKVSISGVHPKLLVAFDKKTNALLRDDTGGFILKPQSPYFPNLPENEDCCMDLAGLLDIDVPVHCLVPLKDKSLAYVVKRFDRHKEEKINQEDFYQILGPKDKYLGSVEQIAKKLKEISSVPGLDVQLFFERVVFNFLIGNGDAHFKNYSIAHRQDGQIRLTPAYDLVCSKLVTQDEESALTINGKNNNLKREDFDTLAERYNIPLKVRYEKFERKFGLIAETIETSHIDRSKQVRFLEIVKERISRLGLTQ